MENSQPTMDILDGSDVDEDNVGDVDADQENVLLESDDEEAHPSHQLSKSMGGKSFEERRRVEVDEEEDVLNIVIQGDEEILDYEGDDNDEDDVSQSQRLPPVKVRNSIVTSVVRESNHPGEEHELDINDPIAGSSNNYDDNGGGARNDDEFAERHYNEDDDYEDGDEETETRTRSRFTTERNVENRAGGSGGGHSHSASTIQTIQTLGEHKVRPNMPDGRPRHWNHNNGPRQGSPLRLNGPRHPGGRNHRFPPPRLGQPGENIHMRPMMNPPVVQFNEGLFTDFNQPMRHQHQGPRPRQSPPGHLHQHPPRNSDPNLHRHHIQPPNSINNNMRPNFPHQMPQQQQRPFFPSPPDNQMRPPPRMQPPGPPGHISHQHQSQQQQPPTRQPPPDFNTRGQRPQRFPQNNMHPHQRHPRPPHNMNQPPNMQRPPFPPRQHRPPFRPDMQPQDPMGMPPHRFPHQQGYAPQHTPHNGPPGFIPPHQHQQHPPRFMGPHGGGPPQDPYYMQQHGGPGNFNHPPVPGEQFPYPSEPTWQGPPEHMPPPAPPNVNHPSNWAHQQQHHPHQQQQAPPLQHQNYNGIGGAYNPNSMQYEQSPPRPPPVHHNSVLGQQASVPIAAALQNAHSLELPPTTSKSIYIKPNSEIHEALSRGGHFRHLKEEDRRHESSSSTHGTGVSGTSSSGGSSSKHYDDYDHDHHHHYHDRERDRERSSSSRRPASPDRRRDRDEDDYYDDRRKPSYHHYDDRDRDSRRPRRKYEEDSRDRRHRSDSPEKKMSRSDHYERDRDRARERDREPAHNKESDKLLEEAKSLGLGEDYVRKLEEQRLLRERILKTKEQRRKQVKVPGTSDVTTDQKSKTISSSSVQKCVENEADSTVATGKGAGNSGSSGGGAVPVVGKTKKVLRIVKDKSGKVISKKVHVVVVGKHQDVQQSSTTS